MRTLSLFATVAAVVGVAVLIKIEATSTAMLGVAAWLAGLAAYRPRWLRLRYSADWVGDPEASHFAAAVMSGLCALLLGALVVWRLTAIHRARISCASALAAAATPHNRILGIEHTIRVPVGDAVSCGELLEK